MTRRASSKFTVEAIETVPMTPEQYQAAVRAFASLIVQWNENRSSDQQISGDKTDQAPQGR